MLAKLGDGAYSSVYKVRRLEDGLTYALKRVKMIGNDMELDRGIGTCGKNGQGVPVGVGQPTLRIDQVTVGGTAT